jgi:hypothetical protein
MPPTIEASIKTKIIQQWLAGDSRPKIAIDNNVGEGTVSSIVNNFKVGLDNSEFDSARELALELKKHKIRLNDLASHFRLYNCFIKSGASENQVDSFIANVGTAEVPPEKIIDLVNELFTISEGESIPLDQLPGYIGKRLQEKQTIDEEIRQADAMLQSKNVSIEAINEHIQLNEELSKHGLSTKHIHKLLNLLLNAKEYRYSPGKIIAKLRNIKRLENKENRLKNSVEMLSKKEAKYKDIIPFTEEIAALGIGINELLVLEIGIKEAAKYYNLPFVSAAMRLIDDIKSLNKINGLKRELDRLSLQKYALDQACSHQSQSLIALSKLKSYGMTEDRILQLNNILENNGYKE